MSKPLNRDELNELKSFLAERIVDNMSTKDLEEYVLDDLFTYYDKMGEHEFIDEAKNYWDDMYDEAVEYSPSSLCKFPMIYKKENNLKTK